MDLKRSDENIADQYPNIFEGLQKDAGQNSWDARATKKGKDWKLIFRYLPARNSIVIEDFGTTGMDEEKWQNYQSLWITDKTKGTSLGARGQGKFLFHYFSSRKLVLTETIDEGGNYRFSYGTQEEYDDENKNLEDFLPGIAPLSHQGTRIWILSVKKELLEELLDVEAFIKYIQLTWWEIIRNYGAKFIVNFDGKDRLVELPKLPKVLKECRYQNQQVKDFGKIKNLVIKYCRDEVPEHLRGVAVQRGGMTILRLPVIAEEGIKNRIYGYCNFDEDLEKELKKIELPNHFGFTNKRAWNHVKNYILKRLDEFVQEITPKKRKLNIDEKLLSEAARVVNNIVAQYAPELAESGSKGDVKQKDGGSGLLSPKAKPLVRIDIFKSNSRKFDYDETLIIDCQVVNELAEEKDLSLEVELKRKGGIKKAQFSYRFLLTPGERRKVDIPLIDIVKDEYEPGEYKAWGVLKEAKTYEKLHDRSFVFYVHESPPPKGKNFMTTFQIIASGKNLYFEKLRNLPITEKGIIHVIWDHPYFVHTRESVKGRKVKAREIILYLIKIGLDEAERKLFELYQSEDALDLDRIREIKQMRDQMYYDAYGPFARLLGR